MKRLLFLLIVAVTVGVMAGLVNAQGVLLERSIVGDDNDAEENMASGGAMDLGSSDLELGWDGSEDQIVGLRFQDIQIPAGATIFSATVAFTTDRSAGTEDENCYLTIYGRLFDPGLFTSAAGNLSTTGIADETTAEVEWTMLQSDTASHWTQGVSDAASTSPDLSTIVQEIIDAPAWATGNALVLLFENGNTQGKAGSGNQRRAESFDGGDVLAPILHIEYMPITAWDPTPADNSWALIDLPLLEWAMPDPLVEGDTLTVDVYFGTDPNLIVGLYGTVQAETDAVVVSTGNFGRPLTLNEDYYWRVDVIDPNGGFGGVDIITGDTWTFTTTVPPEIIIEETDDSTEVSEQDRDVNSDTYTIALSTNPTSAVTIDIFENLPSAIVIPIASGNDDAEEHLNEGGGNIDLGSSDLELGYEQNVPDPQLVGLLFRNVPVNGAGAISSAYVEFDADQTDTGELHLLVAAEKNAFPDNISGTDKDLSRRVQTDTKIVWDVEDWTVQHDKYNTPDITAVIEEIVSDPDWRSGGDIMILVGLDPAFLVNGLPTGQVNREAEAATPYPVLYINWAAPSQLEIIPSQVILTAEEAPETITVKAIDDSFLESDPHFASIGYTITTSDTAYGALTPVDIDVTIAENECGAWGLHPLDLNDDCAVDIGDLAVFAADFGKCTEPFELNCNNLSN